MTIPAPIAGKLYRFKAAWVRSEAHAGYNAWLAVPKHGKPIRMKYAGNPLLLCTGRIEYVEYDLRKMELYEFLYGNSYFFVDDVFMFNLELA